MNCLSNERIQAVADNEAAAAERDHAASCAACGAQVAARREAMQAIRASMNEVEMPALTARRVEIALAGGPARGATRLTATPADAGRRALWGGLGLAAATLAGVLFVVPLFKSAETAVSATEVLARSATALQASATGIEFLEYELVLDGVTREMMPDHENGTYRVRQVIDHTRPDRFRFASFAPDGRPISSIAQDGGGRRTMAFETEGQWFRFDVSVPNSSSPSLPAMERLHMEATIAMMQASGQQMLEVVESGGRRHYRIEVPRVSAPLSGQVWDLAEARVLIDADDYRVSELAVKGTFLRQPYSVSYRLISRTLADRAAADAFEVPRRNGEILIEGDGTVIPARDAMVLALRELARLTRER